MPITDVRLNHNKLKLIAGIICIGVGSIAAFLDSFIGRSFSAIGAVFFGIIGSYLLATSQKLGKDIVIELTEALKFKVNMKEVKIKNTQNKK